MKAALANIRLYFLRLSEREYHLSSFNNTKSSSSLLSVFHLHKEELVPLLKHTLRLGWRANPGPGSGGGGGGGNGESQQQHLQCHIPACLSSIQPTSQPPVHPSQCAASLPLSLKSSPSSPIWAWDDKQLINFPDARRSKTQAGEEDCL